MEKPETEIILPPEHAILEFGDGCLATWFTATEIEENGKIVMDILIEPTLFLRKKYGIRDTDLNANHQMHFKADKVDIIPINVYDSANRKWLYTKTFNGMSTNVDKLGENLKSQINQLTERIYSLEGDIIYLSEQLELAKTNPGEFASQSLELAERMTSIIARNMPQKKGEVAADGG